MLIESFGKSLFFPPIDGRGTIEDELYPLIVNAQRGELEDPFRKTVYQITILAITLLRSLVAVFDLTESLFCKNLPAPIPFRLFRSNLHCIKLNLHGLFTPLYYTVKQLIGSPTYKNLK